MQRQPYLIDRYLRYYLVASIVTLAVANFNTVIDSMLMGRFLGPEAIAAINMVLPVQTCIVALCELLCAGAALLAAKALGKMDYAETRSIFTLSSIAVVVVGVLMFVGGWLFTDNIADLLCGKDNLHELVRSYMSVCICAGILTIMCSGLGQFIDVAGNPRMVTKAMIISMVINIFCDILYVYVLGGGIAFAAIATATGYSASIIYMMTYVKNPDCPYHFDLHDLQWVKRLKEFLINGIPTAIAQLSIAALIFMINHYIYKALGADGMFVVAIGVVFISISFTVANGVAMSFFSIGGMLVGQGDTRGLKMLFKSSFWLVLISVVAFVLLGVCCPTYIAEVFGAKDEALLEIAREGLPNIVMFIPGLCAAALMGVVYQVIGFFGISQIASISALACLFVSFIFSSSYFLAKNIWYAFPLATIVIMVSILLASEVHRRFISCDREFITLLPKLKDDSNIMDISISCNEQDMALALEQINIFCADQCSEDIGKKIYECLTELLNNLRQHGGDLQGHYVDVKIAVEKELATVHIRDDGPAFDPVNYPQEQRKDGLQKMHRYSDKMDYRYSFGQNTLVLQFEMSNK